MTKKPQRTCFANEIIAEFLPPPKPSNKAIIFLSGMPSVPKLADTLRFYSEKGFWVFHPRYRGSWESKGSFLKFSPQKDVVDIINQLPKGFKDLATDQWYKIKNPSVYLFGCSFGGPAALLFSSDKRVVKIVALSPVIDWRADSKVEPLSWLFPYIQKAYGPAYRLTKKNWQKLALGTFYNPITETKKVIGQKILMFQAKDDQLVPWQPAVRFCQETNAKLILMQKGGHFSSSLFSSPFFAKRVLPFVKQ